uniref:Ribosomal protein S8 n=1 Tax=Ophirina amphinema TaxID=2108040 RepID=A0A348AYR7_9EUKA|nr:ribosomal protein S8 [Ophirina amphinema]
MSNIDLLSDSLTRIRNGYMSNRKSVKLVKSKLVYDLVGALYRCGYVQSYEVVDQFVVVFLRYIFQKPAVRNIIRVSKLSCRVHVSCRDLKSNPSSTGLGTLVISTSYGILSEMEAIRLGVGGEVLCKVF